MLSVSCCNRDDKYRGDYYRYPHPVLLGQDFSLVEKTTPYMDCVGDILTPTFVGPRIAHRMQLRFHRA